MFIIGKRLEKETVKKTDGMHHITSCMIIIIVMMTMEIIIIIIMIIIIIIIIIIISTATWVINTNITYRKSYLILS